MYIRRVVGAKKMLFQSLSFGMDSGRVRWSCTLHHSAGGQLCPHAIVDSRQISIITKRVISLISWTSPLVSVPLTASQASANKQEYTSHLHAIASAPGGAENLCTFAREKVFRRSLGLCHAYLPEISRFTLERACKTYKIKHLLYAGASSGKLANHT